jgi:tRNA-splicing ligase RtcB (3'-phosphate/5'-hydroxy nucleic acid ligase)
MDKLEFSLVPEGRFRTRIPRTGPMRADGLIYASREMIAALGEDQSPRQVANVACLPGIVGASLAMPDFHWGYGFPIGGVAAFDADAGVVSPGGIGYDINCGVRLVRTDLDIIDARPHLGELADALYASIPSGVGSHRKDIRLERKDLAGVLQQGAHWGVKQGWGERADTDVVEEQGCLDEADPDAVTDRAGSRGSAQLGTLGSGNHFCEVGYVDEIHDEEVAETFGLRPGGVTVLIHTGSRGLGYQVCDDSLAMMMEASKKAGIALPDRQLCCAPLGSAEARRYLGAMAAAANFAFCNRQVITHFVRESFHQVFGGAPADLAMRVVYDVCHNIGKWEEHEVEGRRRRLFVHRKGATRALPAGDARVPDIYRGVGQPVLVPGDMGRYSFVLVGSPQASREAFSSSCHGAGRMLSRKAAKKEARKRHVIKELEAQGILVRAASRATVDEEMPEAYKDVADVVAVVEGAGLARKVARLRPVAVIKG